MTDKDQRFVGSIPEFYDSYLVPLIFAGYATDLAERTSVLTPKYILETAAGTGAVTRELAARLSPDAHYVVTDLNQPMLDRAASIQRSDNRIEWRQADALNLPFDDNMFDAVVCQFGVMFFPDKIAGYAEARRTLRPGGKFLFNVWDRIDANDFACIVTEAAATVFPADPPRFLARTPHGYHDVELIRDELKKAGYSAVSISTVGKVSTAPSPRHAAIAFCQGSPLRNEIEARDAKLLDVVIDRAALAISQRYGTGVVSGNIRAHVVTCSR
jgi:ubiquinone/menaquinone biosynthesis C-methylase UbiE